MKAKEMSRQAIKDEFATRGDSIHRLACEAANFAIDAQVQVIEFGSAKPALEMARHRLQTALKHVKRLESIS